MPPPRRNQGDTIRTSIVIERWKADLIKACHIDYALVFDRGFDDLLKNGENRLTKDFLRHRQEEKTVQRKILDEEIRMIDTYLQRKQDIPAKICTSTDEPVVPRPLQASIRNAVITVFRSNNKDLTRGAAEVSALVGRAVTVQECRDEMVHLGMITTEEL